MKGLDEIKADNDRAAARELAELRADTVKGLRHAFATGQANGIIILLQEAEVMTSVFDWFVDRGLEPYPPRKPGTGKQA
jgi:hypothetical protein